MAHPVRPHALSFVTPRGDTAQVPVRFYPADTPRRGCWLLLAHGAGAGQDSPFMVSYAVGLATRGLDVTTFNFPYIEAHRRMPDPAPTLEACYRAVIRHVRGLAGGSPVFIGGKSMGGRIASRVAAEPTALAEDVAGLVLLGYPLHPPGKPGQPRTAHWPRVRIPALFVQGTRDGFGTPDELRAALPLLAGRAALHLVEGGDHSLSLRRAERGRQAAVVARVHDVIVGWILERLA